MSKSIKIVHNAVKAAMVDPDRDARLLVNELLSYKIESGIKGMGVAHGSMFEMAKNQFPTGFVRVVQKKLEQAGYKVMVQSKPAPDAQGPLMPVVSDFAPDLRYSYQPETMERLVKLKRMIAQIATGGGKSEIFKLCCERLGLPTLFITTRKSLMYQMAAGYKSVKSKRPIGILGDGKWDPQPNGVNFAIVDTLVSRLEETSVEIELDKIATRQAALIEKTIAELMKKAKLPTTPALIKKADQATLDKIVRIKKAVNAKYCLDNDATLKKAEDAYKRKKALRDETISFLETVGFLTLEEAHEVSGNGFFALCNAMKNAHYRLALTATPNMKDSEEANMRLTAVTGPIGIKVSEKTLIDLGILAKPIFKFIKSKNPDGVVRGTAFPTAYERGIVKNAGRNLQIVEHVKEAKSFGLTAMVLVQRTDHGTALKNLLKAAGIRAEFIQGENDQAARQAALNALGAGKIDCLIGTTILDVGVDVPSVGMVILAGGGKAEVAVRQRIGRGLRRKKSGPNVCYVVMIHDNWNNHTNSHSLECKRIILETSGFAENVVEKFDLEADGFTRV